jgi:hypothetical protein
MNVIYIYISVLLLFLATGCTTILHSKVEVVSVARSVGLGHLYYTGSDEAFHYFVKSSFMSFDSHYRTPQDAYSIKNIFPRSNDKTKWIPYLIDGSKKTEGFSERNQNK